MRAAHIVLLDDIILGRITFTTRMLILKVLPRRQLKFAFFRSPKVHIVLKAQLLDTVETSVFASK